MNNNSKRPKPEQVNINLQKTISGLISTVISSLCQQFIRYERSVDIFGLVSINIDDDVEVSVKINERFTKKESTSNFTNFDCSKLIETIKKNVVEKQNTTEEINSNKIDTEEIIKDYNSYYESNDNDHLKQKRKPRKPLQTYRHIIDDVQQRLGFQRASSNEESKNITQNIAFEKEKSVTDINNESITNSVENIGEKINLIEEEIMVNSQESPCDEEDSNSCKQNISLKCTICDRQFKRKFFLARHKRAHLNAKAYNCNMCGMSFDLTNQLKRHLRNMHMNNRDNLRRSCVKYQKSEENIIKSEDINLSTCSSSKTNSLPVYSTCTPKISTINSQQMMSKSTTFASFSYPPGLVMSQSGKKQICNTFTLPTSVPNHYQVRQMYTSMGQGSETTYPYNNSMYFIQNYPQIVPNLSQSLYSSTISTTLSNSGTSNNNNLQRLPMYHFSSNIMSSPPMKSIPSTNHISSSNISSNETILVDKSILPKSEMSA